MSALLWVDDQVERYQPYIRTFEEHGLQVCAEKTIRGGMKQLKNREFDYVFMDLMMGHESAMPVLPQLASRAKNARFFIVSGFFYLNDVIEQYARTIEESGLSIARLDKTSLPFIDDTAAVKDFLHELESGFGEGNHVDSEQIVGFEFERFDPLLQIGRAHV